MNQSAFQFLVARGAEPSTYAGLGLVLALIGMHVDPGTLQAFVGAATGVCGLAAVLLKEYGSRPNPANPS